MHTAKSHIKIVHATTTQNVVAARAFDRYVFKRNARDASYANTATFADGQTRTATRTITFDAPPVVVFTSPNDFQTFGPINSNSPRDLTGNVERPVTLTGTVSKPLAQITRVMINQQSATLTATPGSNGSTTTFTFPNFFLREGTNLVTATATDAGGQIGTASLTLYVDQTAPILTLEAPVNTGLAGLAMPFGKSNNTPSAVVPQALTSNAKIDVRGIVNDAVEGGLKVPYPTVTINNITTGLTTPGKVSDRYFIVEDVPLDVGQNELTVTATDWVGNARSQKLIVSRVNVGSNRITLAGGNRQRGALNTELVRPLIVTAIDKNGLPLANNTLTFEVLRGTGSINPATTSSTTTTTGTGSNPVTTTIPNALTGALQPKTKPNGVNPARRLLINTDANGRAAVWFTLGKQSGEAGNMVQVSGSDANSSNATLANSTSDAISESVVFTATGDRGVPAKILAEGGGAQYAETGAQPLDALTAVTYDGEVNPVPSAVIAYVIEQDGGVDLDDGAKFTTSSASNALAISANRKVLITLADNNGRSAARPTMGTATGTVRVSTYAMPPLAPNTTVRPELVEGLANASNGTNNALTTTPGLVGLATFQIAVLPQSDGPTQFTGKILDHTGKPLQGVRVTISRTPLSVTTDTSGNFSFLQDVPQGKLDLFVDGRAVTGTTPLPGGQTTPTQYPSLHFEVLAIRGQKNILPHPIYLPPLLMSQAKIVGGSEDVTLTIPGRDGFEMIVKANSVTFPDGSRIGPLVVSPVADDRLPMSPPGGGASFMPGAAATLQPSGTRFDPPIEVRLPNTSGYAPGERVAIYHWDHDIGQYVAMGQATVTDDGAQLITDPGSGITKAGWHGPPVPPTCPDQGAAKKCDEVCEEQKTSTVNGCQQTACESKKIDSLDIEGVRDLPNPSDTETNYVTFDYNPKTGTGTQFTANVGVVPAGVGSSAIWKISPLNAVTAEATDTLPTDKKGAQFQFKVKAANHPEYGSGGSTGRSAPLAYSLEVTVCKDKKNSRSKTIRFAQDQRDIIRQEYLNHEIRTPSRDNITAVTGTTDFAPANMPNAYTFAWGQPLTMAQGILDAWRASMAQQFGGNPTQYILRLNSGWRNPERNEAVNGVLNSKHQFGAAVDLTPSSIGTATRAQAFCALLQAGLTVAPFCIPERNAVQLNSCEDRTISHVHCDTRE